MNLSLMRVRKESDKKLRLSVEEYRKSNLQVNTLESRDPKILDGYHSFLHGLFTLSHGIHLMTWSMWPDIKNNLLRLLHFVQLANVICERLER